MISDSEIDELDAKLKHGACIWWIGDENEAHQCVRVHYPASKLEDSSGDACPSVVLKGGGYVDLNNARPDQFFVPFFTAKKE